MARVKDNRKVSFMEDSLRERKDLQDLFAKGVREALRGGGAVAEISAEVDRLSELVSSVQAAVYSGTQVAEKEITRLTEMFERQLLKLDGIEAQGEVRVQRKMEVRRIQSFVDALDALKAKNSNFSVSKIPSVEVESSTVVPVTKPSSTTNTIEGSLMERVSSLLASLSQSNSTSPTSAESILDSTFSSAFLDFKEFLAKDFEEVVSKENYQRMQTVIHTLCSQPRKLPPRLINPIKDLQYLFPSMVEKWNKSHECLTGHQATKKKLEETNKVLEEYSTAKKTWEEEIEALSNEEKNLEARLSSIKNRKEKIANMQQNMDEQINELISLPDIRSTSLSEVQEAIDIEQETIAYTRSSWIQFRSTID